MILPKDEERVGKMVYWMALWLGDEWILRIEAQVAPFLHQLGQHV